MQRSDCRLHYTEVRLLCFVACSGMQSDVSEAITLLLATARFGIAGAPEALLRMLPLVFSREQGVCY